MGSCSWPKAMTMWMLLRNAPGLSVTSHNHVMGAVGPSAPATALEIFHNFAQDGVVADAMSFNEAIACYGRLGQWQESLQQLEEMSKRDLVPEPPLSLDLRGQISCLLNGCKMLFTRMKAQGLCRRTFLQSCLTCQAGVHGSTHTFPTADVRFLGPWNRGACVLATALCADGSWCDQVAGRLFRG
eukprot:g23458.t1